ncbi:MAG: YbjQ family protein [Phycisphaerae bacterium]
MLQVLLGVVPFLFFLALGFAVGSWRERNHLRALSAREKEFTDIRISTIQTVPDPETVREAALVSGGVVIAADYFKTTAAQIRKLVGGEMGAIRTLVERAQREATLRLLAEARRMGATEVWNIRYETSSIRGADKYQAAASVELFVYGTAVIRQ